VEERTPKTKIDKNKGGRSAKGKTLLKVRESSRKDAGKAKLIRGGVLGRQQCREKRNAG